MNELLAGARVRLTAIFKRGERLVEAKSVKATVDYNGRTTTFSGEGIRSSELGHYYLELQLTKPGSLTVTFTCASGDRQTAQYNVVEKPLVHGDLPVEVTEGEVNRVIRWMQQQQKVPEPRVDERPAPLVSVPLPPLDRQQARTRLLAAGIPYDDAWSDTKIKAALTALDERARQRSLSHS